MPTDRIYAPHERPVVAVLYPGPGDIGEWRVGELRMWQWVDGGWLAQVQTDPGTHGRLTLRLG